MELFLVRREAVYYHEVAGIFDSVEAARATAITCAEYDCDNHHEYVVYKYQLGASRLTGGEGDPYHNPVEEQMEKLGWVSKDNRENLV